MKTESDNKEQTESYFMEMYCVNSQKFVEPPFMVKMIVDEILLLMEVDSGAGVSVISKTVFENKFPQGFLKETSVRLKSYNGNIIVPEGEIVVDMRYNDISIPNCRLLAVDRGGTCLLGRDLMKLFKFSIGGTHKANNIQVERNLKELIEKYKE